MAEQEQFICHKEVYRKGKLVVCGKPLESQGEPPKFWRCLLTQDGCGISWLDRVVKEKAEQATGGVKNG